MIAPLSITLDTVGGLVTFGSPNLLAFIQSYFIGFGMQLFQRSYFETSVSVVLEYVEVRLPKMIHDFSMWLNNEVQEEVVDQNAALFGNKEKNEESETSDSKVNLSDEQSLRDDNDIESDKVRDQNVIYQVEEHNEHSSEDISFKFKPLTRTVIESEASLSTKFIIDYDKESETDNSEKTESEKLEESDMTLEDGLIEEEVEPLIELYAGYACDNVSLFYSCYFVILLWLFYY